MFTCFIKTKIYFLVLFLFLLVSKSYSEIACSDTDTLEDIGSKFDNFYFSLENYEEAFNCVNISAAMGDAISESWLATFYYEGIVTDVNLPLAYEYFKKASEKGDGFSSWYLGFIYSHGFEGLSINKKKSFEYFKKAYEDQNYAYGRSSLAQHYYFGLGTEIDYQKSFDLLSTFESTLDDFGRSLLAKHYLLGRGTKKNISRGVKLLEQNIDNGHKPSEEQLNILFGTDFLDRNKREPKSIYFYSTERESYIPFGYMGLEKQSKIVELNDSGKYINSISYSKEIINDFINSTNQITKEVCYALMNINWANVQLDNPLLDDDEIRNLNELAYKNNCGDISGSNVVFDMLYFDDNPDYTKIFEILVNEVKNGAGSYPVSFIADLYRDGTGLEKNTFNAYVLYKFKAENSYITLGNTDYDQRQLEDLSEILTSEEIQKANQIVNNINQDFNEIFKIIYNDFVDNNPEILTAKSIDQEKGIESKVSDFQQDVIEKKSEIQKKTYSKVDDEIPPEIILAQDIKVNGLVANLVINVKDESNIEALFIDGVPIVISPENNGEVIVEQTIFVGSENKEIQIVAYDKWGLSKTELIQLTKVVESFDINYGNYYGLIIGNNEYEYLPNLKTAINDSRVISEILKSKYKFKEVIQLENATRKEILVSLYNLKKQLNFKDNLFIYYAGHGEIDRQLNEGYWQPVDSMPEMPTEWIDNNTITSILSTMKAKHILIVADSCYSGLLTRSGSPTLKNSFDNREILLQRLSNKKSRLVFTSGGKEPVQDGGGGDHSIFAKSFIDTLLNNNKEITFTEITQQVIPFVISNSDQTPEFAPLHKSGHDGGDFIFVPSI